RCLRMRRQQYRIDDGPLPASAEHGRRDGAAAADGPQQAPAGGGVGIVVGVGAVVGRRPRTRDRMVVVLVHSNTPLIHVKRPGEDRAARAEPDNRPILTRGSTTGRPVKGSRASLCPRYPYR